MTDRIAENPLTRNLLRKFRPLPASGERRRGLNAPTPSLRARRSNPESRRGDTLDCFVARAPRNDERIES
ncbi:hypothetical protein GWG65_35570 [Bradyrhizobium sp. CSA207]|nr:hypothetical protein [Bradyrhizobium sp. CSA207]